MTWLCTTCIPFSWDFRWLLEDSFVSNHWIIRWFFFCLPCSAPAQHIQNRAHFADNKFCKHFGRYPNHPKKFRSIFDDETLSVGLFNKVSSGCSPSEKQTPPFDLQSPFDCDGLEFTIFKSSNDIVGIFFYEILYDCSISLRMHFKHFKTRIDRQHFSMR